MWSVARTFRAPFAAAKVLFCPSSHKGFPTPKKISLNSLWRNYSSNGRDHGSKTARNKVEPTPIVVGRVAVAGGAIVGLGALYFYGLSLADRPEALINRSKQWPEYVSERIKSTYTYLGRSVILTAASAVACIWSPTIILLMSKLPSGIVVTISGMLGSFALVEILPRHLEIEGKLLGWMLFNGTIAAIIAPLCLMAGPQAIITAALYTVGIVGGVSAIAVCAPSDKFLYMTTPLDIALGATIVAGVSLLFLPPTLAMRVGLYAFSLYGGLLVFSVDLFFNTQCIIHEAETHPIDSTVQFDPMNFSLYSDIYFIFCAVLSNVVI